MPAHATQTLFHRRLTLLMAAIVLAMAPLAVRLGGLSVVRAEELRAEARSKLVRKAWTGTSRGRILDRQGRVLALNRPNYGVAVDYAVLSGEWASARAREFVRRAYRAEWPDLSAARRAALVESVLPFYEAHADRGWLLLAETCGIDPAELFKARETARREVDAMHAHLAERRFQQETADAIARGVKITPEYLAAARRRANRPIREQAGARLILPNIGDRAGFALQQLADEEVELVPFAAHGGAGAAFGRVDRVPRIPGLRVVDTGDREYPFESVTVELDRRRLPSPVRSDGRVELTVEGVASHVVGRLTDRYQRDHVEARRALLASDADFRARVVSEGVDRGEYRADDPAGAAAVELSFEHELRGLRGVRWRRLDTGEEREIPAEPGRDVVLTLDIMLQARVQAVMSPAFGLAVAQPWHRGDDQLPNPTVPDGTALNGAAVVLDIDSGEILAMVSMPEFSRRELRENPGAIFGDEVNAPFVNRAVGKPYAPGSIVKPLVLVGAAQRGSYGPGQAIACTGHLLPNHTNMYRCWIYKRTDGAVTHTSVFGRAIDGAEALCVSCNVFFFTLGQRLGPAGIVQTYREFGLREPFNLGVGFEFQGFLGAGEGRVSTPDAIQMGIGQGPVSWTPLHAADAYATLTRGGVRITPRLVAAVAGRVPATSAAPPVEAPAWAFAMAREGLRRAVSENLGTGHHLTIGGVREPIFNFPQLEIIGKTGTAAASPLTIAAPAPPRVENPDGEEEELNDPRSVRPARRVVRAGDHSWFVVVAGPKGGRPRYVVSVIMEYAGSGGKVAGPIAAEIIRALIAEGYLPPEPERG